jgi:hypothetical protein
MFIITKIPMKTIAYLPIGLFRTAGILFFLMLMSLGINAGDTSRTFNEVDIQLNPQCKIKRFSNGEVLIIKKPGRLGGKTQIH